eukprot:TRINITY_DN4093_c0_g1_i1.p1 TRINITY_DN4093_c0_g1~~TRINITY_DN4093_c0_g1_i1.p1  ORF type:complete len:1123 (+),score=306.55 TRINITY_DN4093_c0_g1_i1:80-3370(+)
MLTPLHDSEQPPPLPDSQQHLPRRRVSFSSDRSAISLLIGRQQQQQSGPLSSRSTPSTAPALARSPQPVAVTSEPPVSNEPERGTPEVAISDSESTELSMVNVSPMSNASCFGEDWVGATAVSPDEPGAPSAFFLSPRAQCFTGGVTKAAQRARLYLRPVPPQEKVDRQRRARVSKHAVLLRQALRLTVDQGTSRPQGTGQPGRPPATARRPSSSRCPSSAPAPELFAVVGGCTVSSGSRGADSVAVAMLPRPPRASLSSSLADAEGWAELRRARVGQWCPAATSKPDPEELLQAESRIMGPAAVHGALSGANARGAALLRSGRGGARQPASPEPPQHQQNAIDLEFMRVAAARLARPYRRRGRPLAELKRTLTKCWIGLRFIVRAMRGAAGAARKSARRGGRGRRREVETVRGEVGRKRVAQEVRLRMALARADRGALAARVRVLQAARRAQRREAFEAAARRAQHAAWCDAALIEQRCEAAALAREALTELHQQRKEALAARAEAVAARHKQRFARKRRTVLRKFGVAKVLLTLAAAIAMRRAMMPSGGLGVARVIGRFKKRMMAAVYRFRIRRFHRWPWLVRALMGSTCRLWLRIKRRRMGAEVVRSFLRTCRGRRPFRVFLRGFYTRIVKCQHYARSWLLYNRMMLARVSKRWVNIEAHLLQCMQVREKFIVSSQDETLSAQDRSIKVALLAGAASQPTELFAGVGLAKGYQVAVRTSPCLTSARAKSSSQLKRAASRSGLKGGSEGAKKGGGAETPTAQASESSQRDAQKGSGEGAADEGEESKGGEADGGHAGSNVKLTRGGHLVARTRLPTSMSHLGISALTPYAACSPAIRLRILKQEIRKERKKWIAASLEREQRFRAVRFFIKTLPPFEPFQYRIRQSQLQNLMFQGRREYLRGLTEQWETLVTRNRSLPYQGLVGIFVQNVMTRWQEEYEESHSKMVLRWRTAGLLPAADDELEKTMVQSVRPPAVASVGGRRRSVVITIDAADEMTTFGALRRPSSTGRIQVPGALHRPQSQASLRGRQSPAPPQQQPPSPEVPQAPAAPDTGAARSQGWFTPARVPRLRTLAAPTAAPARLSPKPPPAPVSLP